MEEKGIKTVYTTCVCNCGGTSHCVLKAHVRGNKVVRVEPDDRYNRNVGREDMGMSDDGLFHNRLQRRPCTMGLLFHLYLHQEDRLLYPIKRAPGSKRGGGEWIRISWDEALDTIAGEMKRIRGKYGMYSVMTPFAPNENLERLFQFWGAGVDGWGWCSFDSSRLMGHVMAGAPARSYSEFCSSSASADLGCAEGSGALAEKRSLRPLPRSGPAVPRGRSQSRAPGDCRPGPPGAQGEEYGAVYVLHER